jgi:uncharacterized membrane protein YeaQ/YmgE (transglycosylase-associated protein family)
MGIVVWIILGLIAGWLASVVMKRNEEQGVMMDIILGIVGAVVGGLIVGLLGFSPVTGLNVYSVIVATLGAIVLIWLGRVIR